MRLDDLDARWRQLSEEVISGMKEWRLQHPKATFQEIEVAVDERLARLRARMLEDAALVSRAAEWEAEAGDRPLCPVCGTPLQPRGRQTRELTTQYDQPIRLERRYAVCPRCETGLFPPG
jgi:NADH pyrophosphatase NudC (nudix superfamily)